MTVVTIVLLSLVLATVTVVVIATMNKSKFAAKCKNCGGVWKSDTCYVTEDSLQTITDYENCE